MPLYNAAADADVRSPATKTDPGGPGGRRLTPVDPFVLIVVVGMTLLVLAILALGFFYPGSGAEQLDWRPTRSPEVEAQNEIDDPVQMLDAINEKRRARGAPELDEDDIERRLAEDAALRARLREDEA